MLTLRTLSRLLAFGAFDNPVSHLQSTCPKDSGDSRLLHDSGIQRLQEPDGQQKKDGIGEDVERDKRAVPGVPVNTCSG